MAHEEAAAWKLRFKRVAEQMCKAKRAVGRFSLRRRPIDFHKIANCQFFFLLTMQSMEKTRVRPQKSELIVRKCLN